MRLSRRQFTKEFKLAAVRQLERGISIAEVAWGPKVNADLLHRWRREFRQGTGTALEPALVEDGGTGGLEPATFYRFDDGGSTRDRDAAHLFTLGWQQLFPAGTENWVETGYGRNVGLTEGSCAHIASI